LNPSRCNSKSQPGNEKEVGDGLAKSPIPRSSIWITSKLWNDAHAPDKVRPALEKTLRDLGVEYLDLYLMHWPVAQLPVTPGEKPKLDKNVSILDTWHAMEELVDAGLVKNIGISNFAKWQVQEILEGARIRPAAHEFETHPYLQQSSFVEWNQKQGIQVIAYSPLGNINPIYHSDLPPTLENPFYVDLAKSYNATPAQLILAWGIQRGTVVIPKSVHEDRIVENLGALKIRISDEDIKAIAAQDKKARFNNPSKGWGVHLFSDLDGGELSGEVLEL
jgi:alcohol dehydrogenase (NADP+)